MARLLVVDDDKGIQKQLKWGLSDYEIIFADDRPSAITQLRRFEPEVITLDLGLPPDPANASEGLAALTEILSLSPNTKVIVITGNTDKEHALKSVELGAYDFYQKPIDVDTLNTIIQRAFNLVSLEEENRRLAKINPALGAIIGNSESILAATKRAEKIAKTEITTLLLGESGTGKEVFARTIHNHSDRADKPFVAINCASIPENLLESELFGYEKGAFTGAAKTTQGKIETAQNGTLFLDEIGDMPLQVQTRLLRVLADGQFYRVGGRQPQSADVRIIAATHQNLEKLVAEGKFREDLFHRLNVIRVHLPPLRERQQDIPRLAAQFLKKAATEMSVEEKRLSAEASAYLSQLSWPGNVRQLENTCRWLTVMASGQEILIADLPPELLETQPSTQVSTGDVDGDWQSLLTQWVDSQLASGKNNILDDAMATFETIMLKRALHHTLGHKQEAAKRLGWGRNTITRKMKELNI